MNQRENLIKKIEVKESQLDTMEQESNTWNSEKLNNSTNAALSKVLADSLRNDIARLKEKLEIASEKSES